jgi:hypothetical protein
MLPFPSKKKRARPGTLPPRLAGLLPKPPVIAAAVVPPVVVVPLVVPPVVVPVVAPPVVVPPVVVPPVVVPVVPWVWSAAERFTLSSWELYVPLR